EGFKVTATFISDEAGFPAKAVKLARD
ncbi:MAG: hypothetical protein KJT03_15415, partial [Verrucomicrobiae bacterium]|nr:hypothetical protein [Verrucomicrobiae bacterium]